MKKLESKLHISNNYADLSSYLELNSISVSISWLSLSLTLHYLL